MISCVPAAFCKCCLTLNLFVLLLIVWSTMFRSICGLICFHLSVQRQLLQTSWSIFVRPLLARACMGRASQEIKRQDPPNKRNGFNTSLLQANQDLEPTPPSTTVAQTPAWAKLRLIKKSISDARDIAASQRPEQIVPCDSDGQCRLQHKQQEVNATNYKARLWRNMLSDYSNIEVQQQLEPIGSCEARA